MPTRKPLFDLFSRARPGPGRWDRLAPAEVEQIARTVRRTPEVMVKVLPRGAQTSEAVCKHLVSFRGHRLQIIPAPCARVVVASSSNC